MQRYFRLDLFLFFKLVDVILGHFIRRSLFRICKGDVLIKNNHRTSSPLVAKACGHFQLVPFDLFRWERVCFKDELFFKNRLGNFLSLAFIHWPDTRGRTWPSSFKILSSATKFRKKPEAFENVTFERSEVLPDYEQKGCHLFRQHSLRFSDSAAYHTA